MKKILTISLLFCFQFLIAQTMQIGDGQVKHEKEMRPCIEVILAPEPDKVKEAWEDFMKKEYDVKLKGYGFLTNKDVLSAEGIDFKAVSNKKMDFYTRIVKEEDMTKMCVYGSFGYDIFINKNGYPLEYKHLEDITKQFLNGFLPGYYTEQIQGIQSSLKDLNDDKGRMENEMEDNRKEIEKLTARNAELTKELNNKVKSIEEKAQILKLREENWSEVRSQLSSFNLKKD